MSLTRFSGGSETSNNTPDNPIMWPHNWVQATSAGHFLEMNNSKDGQRVRIVHGKTKNYIDMDVKKNTQIKSHQDFIVRSDRNGVFEFGWFCSDIMLKLGLIGTVIGFIIMLSSLADITTFDVTLLQGVLTTMGSGMGVALYTTLSALITGVLIAIQYYNLESGCEELFSVLNQISEVSIDSSL